jgi:hypothetical protein
MRRCLFQQRRCGIISVSVGDDQRGIALGWAVAHAATWCTQDGARTLLMRSAATVGRVLVVDAGGVGPPGGRNVKAGRQAADALWVAMWGAPDSKAAKIAFHSLSEQAYCEAISMTVPRTPRRALRTSWFPRLQRSKSSPIPNPRFQPFQKLQLLEHALLSVPKRQPVIGTLPLLPNFVTVISEEIVRTRALVRSRSVLFSGPYGPHSRVKRPPGAVFEKGQTVCSYVGDGLLEHFRSCRTL